MNQTHSARHELYGQTLSFTGTTSISFFAKASERRYISVFIGGDPTVGGATFDVQDGVVSLTSGGTNASIINHGNGWYRCSLTSTKSGSSAIYYCLRTNTSEVNVQTYQGDGTSGMYLWGFQTEIGQSYPTSYIPTDGSAVTRLAETANGAGNVDTFNDSEGVLMAEISALVSSDGSRDIEISDGNTNRIIIQYNSIGTIQVYVLVNGVATYTSEYTTLITQFNKIALKYKENDFALWVDGFEADSSNSGSVFSSNTLTQLDFLKGVDSSLNFYGNTKQIQYHNSVLTDSELEQLTSWDSFIDMATSQLYTIQ